MKTPKALQVARSDTAARPKELARYECRLAKAAAWLLAIAIAALAAACGGTGVDEDAGAASGGGIAAVPRNRTLIVDCAETQSCTGQIQDYDSFNPYLPAFTSRTGSNFLYEPLYYYNAFRETDNLIPWIALGHEYNVSVRQSHRAVKARRA